MSIKLICAISKNNVIGNENKLPWNIPEDLKRFKELTSNNWIVMGRKTFDSIGTVSYTHLTLPTMMSV